MTQIAPSFRQERVRDQGSERVRQGEGAAEGTHAAAFAHRPTAAIYGGKDQQSGQGQGNGNRDAVQFLQDAKTGELRQVARGVVRKQQLDLFPSDSPLRLIGEQAQPAVFQRETMADRNRKDYMATPFHATAKFSPLQGKQITFSEDDSPFKASRPFDARATTLPQGEYDQVMAGMLNARLNRIPVSTWMNRLAG